MRSLLGFVLGFGGACGVGAYFTLRTWGWILGGLALAVFGVLAVLRRRLGKFAVLGFVFLGLALGFFWFRGCDWLYLRPVRLLDGQTMEITFLAEDFPTETRYGFFVDGSVRIQGRRYKTRLYLERSEKLPEPGKRLKLLVRLRFTADGGGEAPTYHRGQGIFLLAYPKGSVGRLPGKIENSRICLARWRYRVLSLLKAVFPADTQGFAQALFLGDTAYIDYETDTAFRISGIRHIVAVSGLHISILFSAVYMLTGRRRVLTALLGIPVLLGFAGVVGFTPSVTRAVLMQLLMLLAMLWNREYDPPTALAFAALVMLIANPMVITSVSFQLSVGCVAGILLFSRRIQGWLLSDRCLGRAAGKSLGKKLKRWFAGSVSVTLGSMVLTTPLCAIYFHAVSLVSVLTNLLTLPVVTVIFYGILLICGIGWLSLPVAGAVAWALSWGIRYVTAVAKALASIPLAAVYTRSIYIVCWLIFVYLLLGIFLTSRKKRPWVLTACAAVGLCGALLVSWLEPLVGTCCVTVLDVGQGQCVLLQSRGRSYLVDCGGDSDEKAADLAAETLLSRGISRLDGLILTHYDRDHSGGIPYLLSRVDADLVFLPDAEDENGVGEKVAAKTRGTVVSVAETLELTFGGAVLTIYPPAIPTDGNDASLAVLFQTENCGILIPGDRGGFGERRLVAEGIPDVDLLVVGHHGSANSTCPELLQAARPEIAVISVSADNPYGHPRQEVLDRLTAAGCSIYRTDLDGTMDFRR